MSETAGRGLATGQSSSALIYLGTSVFVGLANLLVLPLVTGYLGTEEYGRLSIAYALMGFVMVGVDPGTSQMYGVLLFDREHQPRSTFWNCLYVYAAFGLLVGGVLMAAYPLLSPFVGTLPFYYFALVLGTAWAEAVFQHVRISIRMEQQAWHYGTLMLVRFVLMNAAFIVLLMMKAGLSELKFMTQFGVTLALSVLYIHSRWGAVGSVPLERVLFQKILRLGLPIFPAVLLTAASRGSDRFMVEHHLGLADVGRYEFAMQIAAPMVLLADNFTEAARPVLYRRFSDGGNIAGFLASQQRVYVTALSIAGVFLMFFSDTAVRLLSGEDFSAAALLIPIITFGYILKGMASLYDAAHYFHRRTALLSAFGVLSLAAMLGLNWVLLPRLGVTAAAISFSASVALYLGLTYGLWLRTLGSRDGRSEAIAGIALVAAIIASVSSPSLLLSAALCAVFSAAMLFVSWRDVLEFGFSRDAAAPTDPKL